MPRTENEHTETTYLKADEVVKIILDNNEFLRGKNLKELCQRVIKEFEVSEPTAYRYIKLAKAEIRQLGKKDKEKAFNKANRRIELIWLKAKDEDLKLALEANKEFCKLHGLYEEQKVKSEVINKNINYDNLTDKALRRLEAGEDPDVVLSDVTSYRHNEPGTDTSAG
jgi:hypothetical protein